jgi:Lrp/AsnC family transcriptional regulator, leucine-responsive regulatory protein
MLHRVPRAGEADARAALFWHEQARFRMAAPLDAFDIAILNLLQRDSGTTADMLAASVPLSPSAIARRIRRLRADGVIERDMALLAPELVGRRLHAIVHVQLHEHAQHRGLEALRRRLIDADEVQIAAEVSGGFDLMLMVVARDMPDFNRFADAMLAGDPVVRRYETSFVKKVIKRSLTVALDAGDIRD